MKTLITLMLILVSAQTNANCNFTFEQSRVIENAISYGEHFNYSQTLAAITVKESFVGDKIVRMENSDFPFGSYGVTHIKLDTAMWLEGVTNVWDAKQDIFVKLVTDDQYAFELAVKKLESIDHIRNGDWTTKLQNYNGGSKKKLYAREVKERLSVLKKCGYFDWS
jgi:hypothetical protein